LLEHLTSRDGIEHGDLAILCILRGIGTSAALVSVTDQYAAHEIRELTQD
jgi:hypothetical protein